MKKASILILAAVLLVAVSSMVLAEGSDNINVIVNVAEKVEVSEPGSIVLSILDEDPVYEGSTSFSVKSNYTVYVDFKSAGYGDTFMNNNISYSYAYGNNEGSFSPEDIVEGFSVSAGVTDVNFTAEFNESAITNNDEWVNISADSDYSDTIIVTVSGE